MRQLKRPGYGTVEREVWAVERDWIWLFCTPIIILKLINISL
jgi:hypothetical protein